MFPPSQVWAGGREARKEVSKGKTTFGHLFSDNSLSEIFAVDWLYLIRE
jgi:hypothetical protein